MNHIDERFIVKTCHDGQFATAVPNSGDSAWFFVQRYSTVAMAILGVNNYNGTFSNTWIYNYSNQFTFVNNNQGTYQFTYAGQTGHAGLYGFMLKRNN